MVKFTKVHLFSVIGVVVFGLWYFVQNYKVVEKFEDCWCRADGGPSQSAGDLTPHLKRFAQILTNTKYLVGREAGTSMLYFAPAPLKPDTTWKYMNGLLGNIALSDKYVLGTNRDGAIYAADVSAATDAIYSAPGWYNIPGGALQVAVADDQLWVLNAAGEIFSCPPGNCRDGKWTKMGGSGYDIGFDSANKRLVLRGNDNAKYICPTSPTPCTGNWTKV